MERLFFAKRFAFVFFTLLMTITAYAATPALPEAIGQVVWVKNKLEAESPNAAIRILARRSDIYEQDTLITDATSTGEISFTDGSALALQENSTVKIDRYNYGKGSAPNNDAFVVNVLKGGFRTITGAISKNNPGGYKTTTSVATIGVMGTIYSVYFDPLKKTLSAKLDKGSISISNEAGNITLTKCDTNKKGTSSVNCINQIYAEVNGVHSAPQIISTQPGVFNTEPPLTNPYAPKSSGLVGSFCIN